MSFKSICLESTSQIFSSYSGLFLIEELWKMQQLDKRVQRLLPRKRKNKGAKQVDKVKALLFYFALGKDSLSDFDDLRNDALFRGLAGNGVPSSTMRDFLKSFGRRHKEKLQDFLIEMALELRTTLFDEKRFILTMDSTPHEHYAKKMEGMAFNYKNYWCLDSQSAYDQFGLSYLFDLRPGNTFSGKDAEFWIHKIFSRVPESLERWFRADSAYGAHKVYEALQVKGVKFAIVLRENIGRYVRAKNQNLLEWRRSKTRFFDSDECEVAMGLYPVKQLGQLRVVFIRAPRRDTQLDFFTDPNEEGYQYYSIITNIGSDLMSEEEVIDFYRGRANAENYIREQKYGYDFLNFPCRRLRSNQIYGLVGTMAHNLMRALSMCMDQKVKRVRGKDEKVRTVVQLGYFAKKIRTILMTIPCQVVRSARKVKLRLNKASKEVFERICEKMKKIQRGRYVLSSNNERAF